MPNYPVNLCGADIVAQPRVRRDLRRHLDRLAPDQPIIIMVHGFKHAPSSPGNSPHAHILAMDPIKCWKAISWPRALGATEAGRDEPLCIALGWEARGTLWQAYGAAARAGRGLAALVRLVQEIRPGAQVQVLAHSLGARVMLRALPDLPASAIGRAVILAAAEMRGPAEVALESPAGRSLSVVNVVSRENAVFDRALAWMIAPHCAQARSVGQGLPRRRLGWTDLHIHAPDHRAALARLGFEIPDARRWACHWSVYLRAGLFPLYRAVLCGTVSVQDLTAALPRPDWTRPRDLQASRSVAGPLWGRGVS